MQITIKSSTIVKPASDTPQCTIWNSNIDMVIPRIHVPTVYFYKAKEGDEGRNYFECGHLKEALGRALVPFYPMAGRLKEAEKGRIDIECNGGGALFVEASTDGCMSEYGEFFAPSMKMRELIPQYDYSKCPSSSFPLLLLQVTVFRCGGVSVGVGVHHHVADGLAALRFINYWADVARGVEEDVKPFFDRTLLRARDPPKPKFAHVEYQTPPPLLEFIDPVKANGDQVEANSDDDYKKNGDYIRMNDDYSEINGKVNGEYSKANGDYNKINGEFSKVNGDYVEVNGDYIKKQDSLSKKLRKEGEHERLLEKVTKVNEEIIDEGVDYGEGGPIVSDLFIFSKELVSSLKSRAAEYAIPGDRPFSSYEVLSAHVWRCACLARNLQDVQMTKLYIATDGRSRLQPPLPFDYFGNVIFTATPMECVGRLVHTPLADAVRHIRKTVQIMDDEYLRSALDYLQLQPDLGCFSRGAHTFRSPNLGITSWVRLPIYGADFGWGPPLSMAPAGVPFEGLAYLLPGPPGDERLRLSITLTPQHMRRFQELIYRF